MIRPGLFFPLKPRPERFDEWNVIELATPP